MRFVLAAGIWCMLAVNSRQSHSHHPGKGEMRKEKKIFCLRASLEENIVYRSFLVTKDASILVAMKSSCKREDKDLCRRRCGLQDREAKVR